jgi:peptidoglycan/xylan/chitin deacetylase (PgdA/CDA1 family)
MARMAETASAVQELLGGPRVLMYHYFGSGPAHGDPDHLFVGEQMLTDQLDALERRGWQALGLDGYLAWLDGAKVPRRSFLLTIDDAHESVLRIAAPLLAARQIPAVLFVPSGLVGGTVEWSAPEYRQERIAPAELLRSLVGTGIELGVHGYDHTRMIDMDAETLRLHVVAARDDLVAMTGARPRAFAYPYGTHDEAARTAIADAGYDVAFAVAREQGRFAKWRIAVDGDDSLGVFRFKLSAPYGLASLAAGRTPGLRHRARAAVSAVRSLRSSSRD